MTVQEVKFDLLASVTSKINVGLISYVDPTPRVARVGDVVAVRTLNESRSYGMLETPSGRLARIKKGGVICGVLGERRALKGIVGEVPPFIGEGDRLSILNLGGVIGQKTGVSSSLGAVVDVEVIGTVCDAVGKVLNIAAHRPPDRRRDSSVGSGRACCRNVYELRKDRCRCRDHSRSGSQRPKGRRCKTYRRRLSSRHPRNAG